MCREQSQAGNRRNQFSLASAMHGAGSNAAAASNGKEAVKEAEVFRPGMLETEAFLGRLTAFHAATLLADALRERPVYPTNYPNANACMISFEWLGCYLSVLSGERNKSDSGKRGARMGRVQQRKTDC